jgi:hypothetical protein
VQLFCCCRALTLDAWRSLGLLAFTSDGKLQHLITSATSGSMKQRKRGTGKDEGVLAEAAPQHISFTSTADDHGGNTMGGDVCQNLAHHRT